MMQANATNPALLSATGRSVKPRPGPDLKVVELERLFTDRRGGRSRMMLQRVELHDFPKRRNWTVVVTFSQVMRARAPVDDRVLV